MLRGRACWRRLSHSRSRGICGMRIMWCRLPAAAVSAASRMCEHCVCCVIATSLRSSVPPGLGSGGSAVTTGSQTLVQEWSTGAFAAGAWPWRLVRGTHTQGRMGRMFVDRKKGGRGGWRVEWSTCQGSLVRVHNVSMVVHSYTDLLYPMQPTRKDPQSVTRTQGNKCALQWYEFQQISSKKSVLHCNPVAPKWHARPHAKVGVSQMSARREHVLPHFFGERKARIVLCVRVPAPTTLSLFGEGFLSTLPWFPSRRRRFLLVSAADETDSAAPPSPCRHGEGVTVPSVQGWGPGVAGISGKHSDPDNSASRSSDCSLFSASG